MKLGRTNKELFMIAVAMGMFCIAFVGTSVYAASTAVLRSGPVYECATEVAATIENFLAYPVTGYLQGYDEAGDPIFLDQDNIPLPVPITAGSGEIGTFVAPAGKCTTNEAYRYEVTLTLDRTPDFGAARVYLHLLSVNGELMRIRME